MLSRLKIEDLLASVRTVESQPATAGEGLIIRRVIEKAEDNWNKQPENDNTATVVVKEFSIDDLAEAAEEIGLRGNEAVIAFLETSFGEDAGENETMTIKPEDVGTLKL